MSEAEILAELKQIKKMLYYLYDKEKSKYNFNRMEFIGEPNSWERNKRRREEEKDTLGSENKEGKK